MPQIQIGLLDTLTYNSKMKMGADYEPNFTTKEMISISPFRGFKVLYNRRYFLNFRRYLKN